MPTHRARFDDDGLEVGPLAPADRDEGFLVARTTCPNLTLERWRAFDGDWRKEGDRRGVAAARNGRGALLGLAFWWRQPDLEAGEALWAGPIVARELGVRPIVRRALLQGVAAVAERLGARLRLAAEAETAPAASAPVERVSANDARRLAGSTKSLFVVGEDD